MKSFFKETVAKTTLVGSLIRGLHGIWRPDHRPYGFKRYSVTSSFDISEQFWPKIGDEKYGGGVKKVSRII